jgi:hypothetical protein
VVGTFGAGSVDLKSGEDVTCTITNDDQPGTIVVVKVAKPAMGTFGFTTTGVGYGGFSLSGATAGGGNQNSQSLNAGTYTVQEGLQPNWTLTGIGGSPDPGTPYSCVVTGSGGSTGVGDLGTQTATVILKNGDTVTCTFENTGTLVTRTQGFWATHQELAEAVWFGGPAGGHTFPGIPTGGHDCSKLNSISNPGRLMAGFWSAIPRTSTGGRRSPLDQARMQLLQQLLAAELNFAAFGSVPLEGSLEAWEGALCGTDAKAVQVAQHQAAAFNSAGDSGIFTPGTSADAKAARLLAALEMAFWDVW